MPSCSAWSTRSMKGHPPFFCVAPFLRRDLLGVAMHHYIAFLRGINLGNRRIKMDQLRALFEEMKFSDVATFIASGNVIFSSKISDAKKIEKQIETHLLQSLKYD